MLDLYKANGSSPPRCGTTKGARCWRATLRARRRVDHWCDDRAQHLGACLCAACGMVIATRPTLPARSREIYDGPRRRAERAAMDAGARWAWNAEVRGWLLWFAVRFIILVAGGKTLTRLGIDGALGGLMLAMVAVLFACGWWLTRGES